MTWATASHRAARFQSLEGRERGLRDSLAEVELVRRSLQRQIEVVVSERERLQCEISGTPDTKEDEQ